MPALQKNSWNPKNWKIDLGIESFSQICDLISLFMDFF